MPTTTLPELVSGNRLTALGAIEAGCRFFAGYPITPSSEIYQTMMEELPRRGGLAVASPDEITALCACVGASMAGHRAMTATSGPGYCLMIETIQYAVMTETPVVVAFVQRLGPSTGGATQGGQGDVLLAEHCTSGGYTVPVFAPATAAECFTLTQVAFAWAERLRTPVVLLSDKEVGMTLEGVDVGALDRVPIAPRRPFEAGNTAYAPYGRACDEEPPPFVPVGGDLKVVATGSAHDAEGRLKKNSAEVLSLLRSLQRKVEAHAREMELVGEDLEPGAETLVVSWGITARAAREAVDRLRAAGRKTSYLQVRTLFPVPEAALARACAGVRRVVVAEENLTGLYATVLERYLKGLRVDRVNAIGSMIPPSAIVEAVEAA
jgi:2-oxoglutarate ferredoxin oxidoreductase subunit alpha